MTDRPDQPNPLGSRAQLGLWLGIAAWTSVIVLTWPLALSFGDEVGYVGQARLLLEGQIRPHADSAGLWFPSQSGPVAKYPLFHALLLLPALMLHPRAVFTVSVLATIGLVWLASRLLVSWGRSPVWALVLLAHPGITILSRTAMADLPFALAAVGAWWALARGRRLWTVVSVACVVATKAPGAVLACLLVCGWAFDRWRAGSIRLADTQHGLFSCGAGLALGGLLTITSNLLTTGTPWFGYDHAQLDVPVFGLRHMGTSGLSHLISILVCPPLLVAGAWPFWKRREFGPLFAIIGYTALMAVYFFVDTAPGRFESLVLSQRLILPAVVFLLIGYADLLAAVAARLRLHPIVVTALLACLALSISATISIHHLRWQRPMAQALAAASRVVAEAGIGDMTLTYEASKVGMLYPGRLHGFVPGSSNAPVVFCGRDSASYRRADLKGSCDFPNYSTAVSIGGFDILVVETKGQSAAP